MGQALYRKYRPRTFADVVGQEAVIDTLVKAIKSGRVSHAYLFSGPRGVGKTSVARILAHEINQIKYSDESIHLDIIEIDGASNRRIDEIRDLRDKVHIAPTSSKYKVYIIDEVHMLTKEAFNALLKTLEEPPAHCVFILATTEPHKIPETITSRTQRFSFKPLGPAQAAKQIASIAKKEKIDIEPEALELLAVHGNGSFRDSLSLLDQLANLPGKITSQKVRELIGLPPTKIIEQLEQAASEGNLQTVMNLCDQLKELALSPAAVAKSLSLALRQGLIEQRVSVVWATGLLKELLGVSASKYPYETLELALLSATETAQPAKPTVATEARTNQPVVEEPVVQEKATTPSKPSPKPASASKFSLELWPKVLETAKQTPGGLYSLLRLARPQLEDTKLVLHFEFPLHYKKLNNAESVKQLEELVTAATGARVTIESQLDELPAAKPEPAAKPKAETEQQLQAISNIFGSAEMLES